MFNTVYLCSNIKSYFASFQDSRIDEELCNHSELDPANWHMTNAFVYYTLIDNDKCESIEIDPRQNRKETNSDGWYTAVQFYSLQCLKPLSVLRLMVLCR